ncbi:hypothetical protein [Streptomyces mayteni]
MEVEDETDLRAEPCTTAEGEEENESPTIRRIRRAVREVNHQTRNNLLARGEG